MINIANAIQAYEDIRMKKTIIYAIMFCILILGITAYSIGQEFTTKQFNNINFSSQNFDINLEKKQISASNMKYIFIFNYTTLRKINDTWTIVPETYTYDYDLFNYVTCRATKTKQACVLEIKNRVINKIKRFIEKERERLIREQNIIALELNESDITITAEELN